MDEGPGVGEYELGNTEPLAPCADCHSVDFCDLAQVQMAFEVGQEQGGSSIQRLTRMLMRGKTHKTFVNLCRIHEIDMRGR